MNRVLKFRVWHKTDNRWLSSSYEEDCYLTFAGSLQGINTVGEPINLNQEDRVVQQFTGMLDKNGKEIYEGDILKWGMSGDHEHFDHRVVEFNEKQLIYKVLNHDTMSITYLYEAMAPSTRWCEVIGNIFETPELL